MTGSLVTTAARVTPLGVMGQFLFAGLALFHDAAFWAFHGALGGLLALPIGIVLFAAYRQERHRTLLRPAGLLAVAYLVQLTLAGLGQATDIGALLALHLVNAGLVLGAAANLADAAAGRGRAVA
ncbi:DUF6220 domain-containing protein [Chthonobacter albigriseus]|uniref:DUF6220 domain-containing protein n=1 Tax=Chthonobacter albigriseus TaxID=1683161 RepID=UPI0015EE5074|nr:DUF6220 domain-containing protein [Chthonobacter albigriseus]